MSVNHQYAGFLNSKLLWKDSSLFDLPQFDFQHNHEIINTEIAIKIPENEVLGKRIEQFFDYFLNSSKDYQTLLKNLQIFQNKITIGEIDFLVKDLLQKQVLHIELIYKFYLYDPNISDASLERWIGPNRKDSLLEKVTKLKEKQLPLLHQPETIARLQEFDISTNSIIQKVCFFGNLFIPLSYQNKQLPHINNGCIVGFWIRAEEFKSEKYGSNVYHIPEKKNWMVHPKYNTTWHTFDHVSEELNKQLSNKKSPLLWIKSNEDSFSKCFVVWW
ncbi:DUF1853 family protein [Aquimarina rubra]|uniref:DUF1853 family protein n=1 Tax=Aquimarina rubra TaxID=1920033 RepID=A0ABW5LCB2_9FLAO